MTDDNAQTQKTDDDVVRLSARAHERDRYLAATLSPTEVQADVFAIAAYLGELARIPVFVSEPMIGEIRLQWWRDALANAGPGVATGHPIADAIAAAMQRHGLSKPLLIGMAEAQSLCLYDEPPRDDMELRQHLIKTHGAAFQLVAQVVAGQPVTDWTDWLNRAGYAYGLARTAVEFGAVLGQGRTLAPRTLLDRHGAQIEGLSARQSQSAGVGILAQLCSTAEAELAGLRKQAPPRAVRYACLPLAMVRPYCTRVRSSGAAAVERSVQVAPITPVLKLGWAAVLGGRI